MNFLYEISRQFLRSVSLHDRHRLWNLLALGLDRLEAHRRRLKKVAGGAPAAAAKADGTVAVMGAIRDDVRAMKEAVVNFVDVYRILVSRFLPAAYATSVLTLCRMVLISVLSMTLSLRLRAVTSLLALCPPPVVVPTGVRIVLCCSSSCLRGGRMRGLTPSLIVSATMTVLTLRAMMVDPCVPTSSQCRPSLGLVSRPLLQLAGAWHRSTTMSTGSLLRSLVQRR